MVDEAARGHARGLPIRIRVIDVGLHGMVVLLAGGDLHARLHQLLLRPTSYLLNLLGLFILPSLVILAVRHRLRILTLPKLGRPVAILVVLVLKVSQLGGLDAFP